MPITLKSTFNRLLGGLISGHMLMEFDPNLFGESLRPKWYNGELLQLASDLASRLLPAFQNSMTGIPFPRVSNWFFFFFSDALIQAYFSK